MPTLGQRKFYDFRMQSLSEVQTALTKLLNERARVEALKLPVAIEKFYQYAGSLQQLSMAGEDKNQPLLLVDQFILTYFDPELVDAFLQTPTDVELYTALSFQLGYLSAATNRTPNLKSYTDEEMKEILRGEGSYYDETVFLHTLREIIEGSPDQSVVAALLATLPPVRDMADVDSVYFWDEALLLGMMLHTVWKHAGLLKSQDQQKLMQNYFYRAIVAGVPVRVWLTEVVEEKSDIMLQWSQMLSRNREHVITNTSEQTGEPFADVIRRYLAAVLSEEISTLAQEKFLKDLYGSQPNKDVYSVWMREALSVVYHIKNQDLLEYSYE